MQRSAKLFVRVVSEILDPPQPVVEIGSLQVAGQEGYADLRPFFPNRLYVGVDTRRGLGVDVIADGEQLPIRDATVGTFVIVDTLEHVKLPWKVLDNVARALKPDGVVIVTSVMDFPIHDYPKDYWRFTPEGLKLLLEKFQVRIIGAEGAKEHPRSVFGLGLKSRNTKWIDIKFQKFKSQFLEQLLKEPRPDKMTSLVRWFVRLLYYTTRKTRVAHIFRQGFFWYDASLELFIEPVVQQEGQPLTTD